MSSPGASRESPRRLRLENDMAHHKRKRPKSRRAGCLMCKTWKAQWMKDSLQALTPQDRRTKDRMDSQEADARRGLDSKDLD